MAMRPSISVVIPVLNEVGSLEDAVTSVLIALGDRFGSYEVLIIDDGSSDGTGVIADRLASANPSIKVIHHRRNMGLGYSYRVGVEAASKEYIGWFPGDNEMELKTLEGMFDSIGQADIVLPYIVNPWDRASHRRFLSWAFIATMNLLFGLGLRSYNGLAIHRTELMRTAISKTSGYAFLAEVLVRLIRAGHTYVEVPNHYRPRESGRTKAFRGKNVASVVTTVLRLLWEVRVRGRTGLTAEVGRR